MFLGGEVAFLFSLTLSLTRLRDFFCGDVTGFFLRLHDFCCGEVV